MTPGTILAGRYRIVRLLGRGGMGAVYEVVDQQLGRSRAVKLMLDHHVDDADARERFEREARLVGRIGSPHVVDVLDAGVDPDQGVPYIVMELLDGETLQQRLRRLGPRPAREVVDHLGQVALALARMHARSVVHRDLKPSNLFVESHGDGLQHVKVLDLGIAKVLSDASGDATAAVGSVPYMAPEQTLGRQVGPATDLYALGLIGFALLTGATYWAPRDGERPVALAMRIARGTDEPASRRARETGVELPAGFDAWFARATARQPSRRFGSASRQVRALADALGVEPPTWLVDDPEPAASSDPPDHDGAAATDAALASTVDGSQAGAEGTVPRTATAPATTSPTLDAAPPAPGSPPPSAAGRPRRPARRRLATSMVALVAGGATLLAWQLGSSPSPPASPLARTGAVLACPVLAVDGDVADWGWLGAAAASVACARARVLLGGAPSRTRAPAELLGLKRTAAFDDEPYGAADARPRSLAAARRSAAYLDGHVSHRSASFLVELVLRRADGTEVKRASADGIALYAAVRAAMSSLIGDAALPVASRPDPVVADYARARDVATMVRLVDLKLAAVNNADGLDAECPWFEDADAATDLASFARYLCRYTLGYPAPAVVLPSGTSPGARAARARVEHMVLRRDDPAAIAALERQYADETSPWGRSVTAATLSCLVQASDRDQALAWAWRAIDDEPDNPTGEWCGPWGQLMSVADDTSSEGPATVGWRIWAPWESYAWWFAARNTTSPERALVYAQRAYVLSPLDTNVAGDLGDRLLRAGRPAAAADVARRLGASRHPVHQILSELLTIRFDASEGRFGKALAAARTALRVEPDDAGWVRAQRLEIAWRAVEVAAVLGTAHEVADVAVAELVDPEPPVLNWESLDTLRFLTAICAYASPAVAERCFVRIADHVPAPGPFVEGARRFAAGDLAGAAVAWRPLVRDATEHVDLLAEAMLTSFASAGDLELADLVTARFAGEATRFDGASMVMARAAQAADARGDHARAAALARQVLDAWADADTRPPILDELRRLAP